MSQTQIVEHLRSAQLLAGYRLHQRSYLYRRESGEGVGYCIRQNDLIAMTNCTAGIDYIGYVALALGRLGANQRPARTRKNLGRIVLVQQDSPNRIVPDGANPVRQQQPAVVQLER